MHKIGKKLFTGSLVVVELEGGKCVFGTAKVDLCDDNAAYVYSGFVGRPIHITLDDIVEVTPANQHPDVVAV